MIGRLSRWMLVSVLLGGGVMALAGQWRSPYLWAVAMGIAGLGCWGTFGILNPELARERFHPPSRGADSIALRWVRLSALATIVVGPLDSGRLHWSAPMPAAVRLVGICGFLFGAWFTLRAMAANQFFSPVVRIQSERGHHVIDNGPYAVIRHPGYLGMIVVCPTFALALGSWWALVPACLYSGLILRRVVFEDRFLRDNLRGYGEYATRVKFRVLPGIW